MNNINALQQVQSGGTGTQADVIDRTLWAEEIIAAAPLVNRLFQNPLGVAGLLLDQTNNTQAGQMPSNRTLSVKAIKVFYVSETTGGIKATAADIQDLYTQIARTTVQLFVNNREFGQWTLQELMGSCLMVALNPAVTFMPPFIAPPKFHGIFPLNQEVTLAGLTQFFVEVTHSVVPTAATIGDRLRIGLSGIETRVN